MTIVVMFGIFESLGLKKQVTGELNSDIFINQFGIDNDSFWAARYKGDADDAIWVIEDRSFTDGMGFPVGFPNVTIDTLLPVILHKTSKFHESQIGWLKGLDHLKPIKLQPGFSHIPSDPRFNKINVWTKRAPSRKEVSDAVNEYSSTVFIGLLDELAAWNFLCIADPGNSQIANRKQKRTEFKKLVATFANLQLNAPENKPEKWLSLLEKEVIKFC